MQFRFVALVILAAAAAACGSSDATAPRTGDNAAITAQGKWTLRTINGQVLPAKIMMNGTLVTFYVDTLDIYGTGSGDYGQDVTYSDRPNPFNSDVPLVSFGGEFGSWSASGDVITFHTSTGERYTGTVSGNTLTENVPGYTQVYSRVDLR